MTIGVLHTTESDPGTGDAVTRYLQRIAAEPHYVIDPSTRFFQQLVPGDTYAKALSNRAGGVETNRRIGGVIQVEIVGRSAEIGGYSDEWYAVLRDQLAEISLAHGVAYEFRPDHTRLTFEQWLDPDLRGWLGHCHVPENDHWDPGTLDYARLYFPTPEDPDMAALQDDTPIKIHPGGDRSASPEFHPVTSALAFAVDASAQAEAASKAVLNVVNQLLSPVPDIRTVPTSVLIAELARRAGP